ncbi:hypothetical protein DPX16_1331 [Anabarilius grahami]|uniref:Uncharacterized protein n=1 Tax=Anabarilius grahami TaxID=495550 RepID=A0A3N0Y7F6_ANAGA|nr:hypothetical protein DPX16_1331 [Anabarilius grahami]
MAHGGWRNRPSEHEPHPSLAGLALCSALWLKQMLQYTDLLFRNSVLSLTARDPITASHSCSCSRPRVDRRRMEGRGAHRICPTPTEEFWKAPLSEREVHVSCEMNASSCLTSPSAPPPKLTSAYTQQESKFRLRF